MRPALAARLLGLLGALLLTLVGRATLAHDLPIDQLALWPEPAAGHLRGQILFDPKLSRRDDGASDAIVRARVVAFLKQNLALEADGRTLALTFEVRELWTGDGAIGGDSVMLDAPMPRNPKTLRIFAGLPLRALAVSVQTTGSTGRSSPLSTLLLGGDWTTFHFTDPSANGPWTEGDPELLAEKVPRHADRERNASPATASPAPPPSSPAVVTAAPAGGFEQPSAWHTASRYLRLGVEHILPNGWDHVLFVAGLVLGSGRRLRSLLLQLGGFTLAHTLTLGLGALGLVVLPARVVEPLIAFSIAVVAVENVVRRGESKYRLGWVMAFGLLHGQGFASGLIATGIPQQSFLVALLSFNLGVEVGQLVVVGVLLALLSLLRDPDKLFRYAVRPASLAIAVVGVYWGVARLFLTSHLGA